MNFSRTCLFVFVLFIAACANHDGIYEPACIAYEGDRIELQDGRFVWDRFTDERKVDAEGNVVPPFPGFPKSGSYRISAGRLELTTDDEVRLDDWFIVERSGKSYLLNGKQHNAFVNSGTLTDCALEFSTTGS